MTTSNLKSYGPLVLAVVLTALGVQALGGARVAAQEQDLAKRVRLLEDKEAINAVLERFFEYQEAGPIESYANLFAKDGELILRQGATRGGPEGFLRGRAGRGGRGGQTAGAAPARPAPRMRHLLSNAHIEVNGDTATAVSRFTLLVATEDNSGVRVGGHGRYHDRLVRENGQWKILRRVIARDLPIDVEGANPKVD